MRSALVLAAIGLWAGCDRPAFAEVIETTRQELKVGGTPRLVVRSDAGPIEVQAGAAGVVKIEARRHARTREEALALDVSVRQDDGVVSVRYDEGHRKWGRSVAFTIVAPAGCKIDVETDGGAVRIDGFTAGIEASTDGGSMTASHVKGVVRLHSDGGAIAINDVDGTVDASTDGGSITLSGRLRGNNRLATDGGSITASLPADSHLEVEGSTDGGSARNEFGLPVEREDGSAHFRGTIGTGSSGSLHMSTDGGSVTLRKG
jgi:hypothetical protein